MRGALYRTLFLPTARPVSLSLSLLRQKHEVCVSRTKKVCSRVDVCRVSVFELRSFGHEKNRLSAFLSMMTSPEKNRAGRGPLLSLCETFPCVIRAPTTGSVIVSCFVLGGGVILQYPVPQKLVCLGALVSKDNFTTCCSELPCGPSFAPLLSIRCPLGIAVVPPLSENCCTRFPPIVCSDRCVAETIGSIRGLVCAFVKPGQSARTESAAATWDFGANRDFSVRSRAH